MREKRSGLRGKVYEAASGGRVLSLDATVEAIFGSSATKADRTRVSSSIANLVAEGRILRVGTHHFRRAPDLDDAVVDHADDVAPAELRPRGRREVESRLNRLAAMVNAACHALHEEIGETRRMLNIPQAPVVMEEPPSGFALRRLGRAERL